MLGSLKSPLWPKQHYNSEKYVKHSVMTPTLMLSLKNIFNRFTWTTMGEMHTVLLDWNSNSFQHFPQDLTISSIYQFFTFHNDWLNSAIFQMEVWDMNSEINPVCDPTAIHKRVLTLKNNLYKMQDDTSHFCLSILKWNAINKFDTQPFTISIEF